MGRVETFVKAYFFIQSHPMHHLRLDIPVPFVALDILDGKPTLRLHDQDTGDEILGSSGEKRWDFVFSRSDLFEEGGHVGVTEGQVAAQHHEKHHTAAPNVALDGIVGLLAKDNLRSCVAG